MDLVVLVLEDLLVVLVYFNRLQPTVGLLYPFFHYELEYQLHFYQYRA